MAMKDLLLKAQAGSSKKRKSGLRAAKAMTAASAHKGKSGHPPRPGGY